MATTSEFIKEWEGLRTTPYRDVAGFWTVGWGHKFDHLTIAQCEGLLADDILIAESAIKTHVVVPLTANQLTVLTSFVFNLGVQAFLASTLLVLLNEGRYDQVPAQLMRWTHAGGHVVPGLVARRRAEGLLWNEPDGV